MKSVFITGANRGLGLEFVKQYIGLGWNVFAGCRKFEAAVELKGLLTPDQIIQIEMSDEDSIKDGCRQLAGRIGKLDLLINNAGVGSHLGRGLDDVDSDDIIRSIEINSIAPILVARETKHLLGNGSLLVNISSLMGSVTDNGSGGSYSYRLSKAALNMASKNLSIELSGDGIIVLNMHPGWVKTDMGGVNAPLNKQESVKGMINVIEGASSRDSGRFLDYTGKEIPW